MPTAGCYVRVSTASQAEKDSPALQREAIQRWLDQHPGWKAQWFEDLGVSGVSVPTAERPAGQKLLAAAEASEIDAVVVYRMDRLGRDLLDAFKIRDLLVDQLGLEIISTTDGGAVSEMMHFMQAMMGREETKKRSRVQRDGVRTLIRQGSYCGGVVAYGFRAVKGDNEARRAGKLVHDTEPLVTIDSEPLSAADVVRRIFSLAADEDRSCVAIAKWLNSYKVPTSYQRIGRDFKRGTRKTKVAGRWSPGAVRRVLKSRCYVGEISWGRRNTKTKARRGKLALLAPDVVTGTIPALVQENTWQRAQAVMARHRWTHSRNTGPTKTGKAPTQYLLRGLMKCAECGRTYVGSNSDKGGKRYTCNGIYKQHSATGDTCSAVAVDYDIDGQVWADIQGFFRDPERLRKALLRSLKALDGKALGKRVKQLKDRRSKLEEKRERLVTAMAEGMLDKPDFARAMAGVKAEQAEVAAQLHEAETAAKSSAPGIARVEATITSVMKPLANKPLTFALRREIVELLVAEARVYTIPLTAPIQIKKAQRWRKKSSLAEVEVVYHFGVTQPYRPLEVDQVRPMPGTVKPARVSPALAAVYAADATDWKGLGRLVGPEEADRVEKAFEKVLTTIRTDRDSWRPRA